MPQMSVAQALNELKLLDARITRTIREGSFVASIVGDARINGRTRAEFNRDAQSSYDSSIALQERRTAIKSAITTSNAATNVTVAGVLMTVAQAIEYRKHGITYKRQLLSQMQQQWSSVNTSITKRNDDLRDRALKQATEATKNMPAADASAMVDSIVRAALERDGAQLVNPLDLAQKIQVLQTEIENFDGQFDLAINASNYATMIEV